MNTYQIDFYKTHELNPAERKAMRRNATGLWLMADFVDAESKHAACAAYRKNPQSVWGNFKLRATFICKINSPFFNPCLAP